jgi:hypothetical protein
MKNRLQCPEQVRWTYNGALIAVKRINAGYFESLQQKTQRKIKHCEFKCLAGFSVMSAVPCLQPPYDRRPVSIDG